MADDLSFDDLIPSAPAQAAPRAPAPSVGDLSFDDLIPASPAPRAPAARAGDVGTPTEAQRTPIFRNGRQVWPPPFVQQGQPTDWTGGQTGQGQQEAPAPVPPPRPRGLGADTGLNVPETPATQAAQQQSVAEGRRPVMMYPKGTPEPPDLPAGMARVRTPRGTFIFDPRQITPQQIRRASRDGRENEILGLGPYNKDDIQQRLQRGEQGLAVTERQPDGTEVRAAVGTPSTAQEQAQAIGAGAAPGNSVQVEPIEGVINGRFANGLPAPPVRPAGLGGPPRVGIGENPAALDAMTAPQNAPVQDQNILDDPGKARDFYGTQDQMLTGQEAYAEQQGKIQAAERDVERQRQRLEAARQREQETFASVRTPGKRGSQTEIQRRLIQNEVQTAQEALTQAERDLSAVRRQPLPRMTEGRSSGEAVARSTVNFFPKTLEGLALLAGSIIGINLGSRSLRNFQDAVDRRLSGDPARREEFLDKMGAGGGSAIGFMLGGAAARGVGMSAKAASGVLGGAGQAADSYREAEAMGEKGYKLALAYATGGAIGATEMFGIGGMLERMDKTTGGGVKRYLGLIMREAGEEAVQEATQALLENMQKLGVFGEDVPLTKDVAENALIGALLGGGMAPATGAGSLRRNRTPFDQAAFERIVRESMSGAQQRNTTTEAPAAPQMQLPGGAVVSISFPQSQERIAPQAPAAVEQPAQTGQNDSPPSSAPAPVVGNPITEQNQQPAPVTIEDTPANRTLRAAGYDVDIIADMSPRQIETALQEAADEGITDPGPGAVSLQAQPAVDDNGGAVNSQPDAGTRTKPVTVTQGAADLAPAAERVNVEPSEAQKAAGNYQKGHARYDGLNVTIENPKGSTRTGTDRDGESWQVQMPAHYGYIKGSTGKDGDQVDVFLGDGQPNGKVWVVDQYDPKTGKFDEHKAVMGVGSAQEAEAIYRGAYPNDADKRFGAITEMSVADFKEKLAKGQLKKAFGKKPSIAQENGPQIPDNAKPVSGGVASLSPQLVASIAEAAQKFPPAKGTKQFWMLLGIDDVKALRAAGIRATSSGIAMADLPKVLGEQQPTAPAQNDTTPVLTDALRKTLEGYGVPVESLPQEFLQRTAALIGEGNLVGDAMVKAAEEFDNGDLWDMAADVKVAETERLSAERQAQREAQKGKKNGKTAAGNAAATTEQASEPASAEAGAGSRPGAAEPVRGEPAAEAPAGRDQAAGKRRKERDRPDRQGAVSENGASAQGDDAARQGSEDRGAGAAEGQDESPALSEVRLAVSKSGKRVDQSMAVPPEGGYETTSASAENITTLSSRVFGENVDPRRIIKNVWGNEDIGDAAFAIRVGPVSENNKRAAEEQAALMAVRHFHEGGPKHKGRTFEVASSTFAKLSDWHAHAPEIIASVAKNMKVEPDQIGAARDTATPRVIPLERSGNVDAVRKMKALIVSAIGMSGSRKITIGGDIAKNGSEFLPIFATALSDVAADYASKGETAEYNLLLDRMSVIVGYQPSEDNRSDILFVFDQNAGPTADAAATSDTRDDFDKAFDDAMDSAYGKEEPKAAEPAKKASPAGDVSNDELPDLIPDGFVYAATPRKLKDSEAQAANRPVGTYTAVVARETPFSSERGYGATMREAIQNALERIQGKKPPAVPLPTDKNYWKQIGVNSKGNPVYEDPRGVRSYTEDGFRFTEAVGIIPGGGIEVGRSRSKEYEPVTAADAAKSAVKNTAEAADAAMSALVKMFAPGGRFGSGLGFDEEGWKEAKPLFIEAGRKFAAAAQDVTRLVSLMVQEMKDRFGLTREAQQNMRPYLRRFVDEVKSGKISLQEQSDGSESGTLDQSGERADSAGVATGWTGGDEASGSLEGSPAQDGGRTRRPSTKSGARSVQQVGGSAEGVPEGGNDAAGRDGAGGSGVASDGAGDGGRRTPAAGRPNYHIADPERLVGGGPKARFARNRAAIEVFRDVSEKGADPTPEQLDAMASYMGWGSFGQELFQGTWENPKPKGGWEAEDRWLRDHLGKDEWESAQRSIINAHYTDPPTVNAMWGMVERMGFNGGRVLEPSMGIGNFFGLMPRDLMAKSDLTGIELDSLTGGMAKLLYPQANISIKGYETSKTPDNFYDLVIGNWPFADIVPADRRYAKLSPNLHDYFFVKGLDQVRPGGLVIGVTSAGTMDKVGKSVRAYLAERAELVAAFRLPSGAFEKYAGTSVVTDIIVLRKREKGSTDVMGSGWYESKPMPTPAGEDIRVNEYYHANPSHVLGRLNFGSGSTYGRPSMIVERPADIEQQLEALPERVPAGVYEPIRRGKEARFIANNTKDRDGSITKSDGTLYVVQGERLVRLEDLRKYKLKDSAKTAAREDQVSQLISLRRLYGTLIDAEREADESTEAKRKELRSAYEAFRAKHGTIADSDGLAIFTRVKDPFTAVIQALEKPDGSPSRILSEPTVRAIKKLENPSIRDAFVLARNETRSLDIDRIAEIAKQPREKVEVELLQSKAIYRTPGGGFEVADLYLSGNVRRKMREAQEALENGDDMEASIKALEAVVPADVPYFNIEAQLGANWVPAIEYRKFIAEMLGVEANDRIDVIFAGGMWRVVFRDAGYNRRPEATALWGHDRYKFNKLVMSAMNNTSPKIYDQTKDGPQLNTQATKEVAEKIAGLREHFTEWAWKEPERRGDLEKNYNEIMNAIATPKFDGSFLEFPGMALRRGDDQFSLRSHQVNAIWRGVANGRGLYAHEVGTGKTYTMGGIAVESRRYGIARKPMIWAHNANSASVAAEIQQMYPGAAILYVDNLSPDAIAATMRRIANEDWDAVVMPHSLADRLSMREETLMEMAQEEIRALEDEARQAALDDEDSIDDVNLDDEEETKKIRSVTAKNLVKQRQRIIETIKDMAQRASKEDAIPFEDLGVDMLIIDEAHEFKKPPITTKMKMKGLNTGISAKSIQLKFVTDFVKKIGGGKGVHIFTGTPITNTLVEIYNMQRYVMSDQMALDGIDNWDPWFNTFAASTNDVELTPAGDYEPVTRLAAFVNVAELRRMIGQYMDIVFADEMPEFKPRASASGKTMQSPDLTDSERRELMDGRTEKPIGRPYKQVISDVAPMSPTQEVILSKLAELSRGFKAMLPKARRETILSGGPESPILVETNAANAGLDARLYDMEAPDHPESKVNRTVRNVAKHYGEHPKSTQVVFVERGYTSEATSTRKQQDGSFLKTKSERFNLVADLVDKLVGEGIPRDQIAVVDGKVSKQKRKEIADKMNRAEIRVAIGNSATLGVGVNMQENLRAMHHMDAPWMPGLLEQRNGRGHRQGNKWNTVLEYRYITEKIDGRRWQVLAVKDRFIKAFLKADESVRVIEGDAVSQDEGEGGDDISKTLSDAAGDSRILMREKLMSDIKKLENRERLHTHGIIDARDRAIEIERRAPEMLRTAESYEADAKTIQQFREEESVEIVVDGVKFDIRKEGQAAIDDFMLKYPFAKASKAAFTALPIKIQGMKISYRWPVLREKPIYAMTGEMQHEIGAVSIASVEATSRYFSTEATNLRTKAADLMQSVGRLRESMKQPFQQAGILEKKRALLDDIVADLQANPVPPPAWLRQGAPVDTLVYADGQERVVRGHKWTNDGYFVVTDEGLVPYMDAKDAQGMPLYEPQAFSAPTIQKPTTAASSIPRLAGITQRAADAGLDRMVVEEIARKAMDQILGPVSESVQLRIADRLQVTDNAAWTQAGAEAFGLYHFGKRLIELSMATSVGGYTRETAAHEVFHFMQNYGFFTEQEIAVMRRDMRRMQDVIARDYGDEAYRMDLTETTAQMFGRYYDAMQARAAERAPPVHVVMRRVFDRLANVLRRIQNWLQGLGFQTADDIFERAGRGEIAANAIATARATGRPPGPDMFQRNGPPRPQASAASPLRRRPDERSMMSKGIEAVADRFVRIRELQNQLQRDAGVVPADVHAALGALNTRISERIDTFEMDELKPLADLVNAAGGQERVNDFLYSRHATERNAYIRSINPMMPDGGSGMTDADAAAKQAMYAADPKLPELQAAAQAIYDMNARDLDRREAQGLIDARTANTYRTQYQYYVPLRGFAGDEWLDDHGSGPGVAVVGAESKMASGRKSEADNIIAQSVSKSLQGFVRIEKNLVDRRLARLAQQMEAHYGTNDSPLIMRTKPPSVQTTNTIPVGIRQLAPAEYGMRPDVMGFKIGGKQAWVEFKGQNELVDQLKNAAFEQMGGAVRALMAITQFYSKMRTAWNVFFAPINFIRDNLDAWVALNAMIGKGGTSAYAKEILPAMRSNFRYVAMGKRDPDFETFRHRGGKMSFAKLRTLDEIKARINRELNGIPLAARPFVALKHIAEGWNDILENTVRFALYKAALANGMSADKAVKLALEGTLNFHRRGASTFTQYFRAVVPFLNPSIQSPLRGARLIADAGGMNTAVGSRALIAGAAKGIGHTYAAFTAAGFLISMWNYFMGGDDDDQIPFWDKAQADYRDEKNILIYTGGKDEKGKPNAIMIPAFPEIMFPYKLGTGVAAAIWGKRGAWDIAKDVGKATYNLSPTEGRGMFTSGRFFIPQPFAAVTDLYNNRNWLEGKIHPDPSRAQRGAPKHMIHWPQTEQVFVDAARALHKIGINMHPEDVRYIAREIAGGYYQPAEWAAKPGGDRPAPVLGRLYADGGILHRKWETDKLAAATAAANTRAAEARAARKANPSAPLPPGVTAGPRGGIQTPDGNVLAQMQRQVKPLYDQMNKARKDGNTAEVKRLQGEIDTIRKRARQQAERARPQATP